MNNGDITEHEVDSKPGNYYVSCKNDGGDYRLLLGPFADNHQAALDEVTKVRLYATQIDPKAIWYSFGTCRVDREPGIEPHQGLLNAHWPVEFVPGTQLLRRTQQPSSGTAFTD